MKPSSTQQHHIRQAEAIYLTTADMISRVGKDNCYFMTLTLKGEYTGERLNEKTQTLLKYITPHFDSLVAVPAMTLKNSHIHLIGVPNTSLLTDYPDKFLLHKRVTNLMDQAKRKARFGKIFRVETIRKTTEAIARYMAKNYLDTAELKSLSHNPKNRRTRGVFYRGVPRQHIVRPGSFRRLTPASQRFRATMTKLSEMAGTELDSYRQLERALGMSANTIRKIVFEIGRHVPYGRNGFSKAVLEEFFPALRYRTANSLAEAA